MKINKSILNILLCLTIQNNIHCLLLDNFSDSLQKEHLLTSGTDKELSDLGLSRKVTNTGRFLKTSQLFYCEGPTPILTYELTKDVISSEKILNFTLKPDFLPSVASSFNVTLFDNNNRTSMTHMSMEYTDETLL